VFRCPPTPALLTFGFIAVFVGAFTTFNTFPITVAQRVGEFGMLRALGEPGQVMRRSVAGEAVVIGVVASVMGIAGGFLALAAVRAGGPAPVVNTGTLYS